MSKIGRFIFTNIPYIEVCDKFMTKYYYIHGKVVRADLVLLYERLKRTARSWFLQMREEKCKHLKLQNEYYERRRCSYCIHKNVGECQNLWVIGVPSLDFRCKPQPTCVGQDLINNKVILNNQRTYSLHFIQPV